MLKFDKVLEAFGMWWRRVVRKNIEVHNNYAHTVRQGVTPDDNSWTTQTAVYLAVW